MEEKNEKYEGDVKLKSPILEKLDNFWYHYKWHTAVAIFVIIVAIILTVQTCSRVEADAYILYAGPHTISRVAANGNISEYENAVSSFKKISTDYNDDGINTVSLVDLFVVNSEESEKILADNPGKEINAALVKENTETLHQKLLFGEYYLCFLSERIAERVSLSASSRSFFRISFFRICTLSRRGFSFFAFAGETSSYTKFAAITARVIYTGIAIFENTSCTSSLV
jgi:hypothetical protein